MKTKREQLFHAEPSPTIEKLKFPKSYQTQLHTKNTSSVEQTPK